MSTITHKFTRPAVDGRVGSVGSLIWTPTKRRELAGETVLPEGFAQPLEADGSIAVDVDDTADDWGWCVIEDVPRGRTRFVLVDGDADYADLEEFDPASGEIKPPLPPVWKSYVDAAIATALALYAATVNIALGLKANVADVVDALALKANVADVYDKAAGDARYATTAQGGKADTAVQPADVDDLVDDALDSYVPGTELGRATIHATNPVTAHTTTATSVGSSAANIPGMTKTFVGIGRPAMINVHLAAVMHSVADKQIIAAIVVNGAIFEVGAVEAPVANKDQVLKLSRPMDTVEGVSYTVDIRLAGETGTKTLGFSGAATYYASWFNIVAA